MNDLFLRYPRPWKVAAVFGPDGPFEVYATGTADDAKNYASFALLVTRNRSLAEFIAASANAVPSEVGGG